MSIESIPTRFIFQPTRSDRILRPELMQAFMAFTAGEARRLRAMGITGPVGAVRQIMKEKAESGELYDSMVMSWICKYLCPDRLTDGMNKTMDAMNGRMRKAGWTITRVRTHVWRIEAPQQ